MIYPIYKTTLIISVTYFLYIYLIWLNLPSRKLFSACITHLTMV